MSDSQVGYAPDWYRKMQAKHAAEEKARRREVEERVHAILAEQSYIRWALCNQLIAAHPMEALELLLAGGYVGHHD
jgi:hypothetical protein